ncbi:MAG: hypothetical protein WCF84_15240 [Anaerolineae bacterium]
MNRKLLRSALRSIAVFVFLFLPLIAGAKIAAGQGPAIAGVMVVQTLGNQSDRYVAGKDTAVVVVFKDPISVDPTKMQVTVTRDGTQVGTMNPLQDVMTTPLGSDPTPVYLMSFVCASRAACGDWVAGNYTFQASISGATAQTTATFKDRKGMRVLAVPVKANYGPGDVRTPTGTYKNLGDFARKVYPVSADKFDWVLGQDVDASGDQFNLTTDDGMFATWKMVAAMQPRPCFEKPRPTDAGCFDQVYGFIKDPIQTKDGTLFGFTYGSSINVGNESNIEAARTVAHEIGHNYGLGDEYNGGQYNCVANPPPATYVGRQFGDPTVTNYSCKDSTSLEPGAPGSSSMLLPKTALPYEVGGRGMITNVVLSFMGNGGGQLPLDYFWITPNAWKQVFDQLEPITTTAAPTSTSGAMAPGATDTPATGSAPAATDTPAATNTPSASALQSQGPDWSTILRQARTSLIIGPDGRVQLAAPRQAQANRWVYAEGTVTIDGKVSLDPWYSYADTSEYTDTTGAPYTLRAVDATGATLASTALDINFNIPDQDKPMTRTAFEADIPFPDKTAAFQVISGTQVLQERKVSAHAPAVTVTSPTVSDSLTGTVTIKWTASDQDNDPLSYYVEYSDDGENWITLATDITSTQWTEDFSALPGTGKPTTQVRVTATDGINATEATSAQLTVAPKPPEVFIDDPQPNSIYEVGDEIALNGSAYDIQADDWIVGDNALVWSSDQQGVLGQGETLYVSNLKLGTHIITLTATDGMSQTAVMTTTIQIVPQGQAPVATPLPTLGPSGTTPAATPTP